jgi:hypothetical protein
MGPSVFPGTEICTRVGALQRNTVSYFYPEFYCTVLIPYVTFYLQLTQCTSVTKGHSVAI